MRPPPVGGLFSFAKFLMWRDLDPEVVEFSGGGNGAAGGEGADGDDDELFDEASRLVVSEGKASASFLQRRMRIGRVLMPRSTR